MAASTHFKSPPFSLRGGRLNPETGKEDFVPYGIHEELAQCVESTFTKPISFRLVYGQSGEGKTWTLSWIWRKFDQRKVDGGECLVVGVPKFDLKRPPERFFVESIIQNVWERRPRMFDLASKSKWASKDLKTIATYLADEEGRNVLMGRGSSARVPRIEGLPAFSMGLSSDLLRILLAVAEGAKLAGYVWLLVLVDELEGPFTLHSKKAVTVFSDFLRDVYDNLEQERSTSAHAQFLFGGTLPVFEQFDPRVVQRQIDEGGVFAAFLRRTEPPFLLRAPKEPELKEIARMRIEIHRRRKEGPFIPFEIGAILLAWKKATQNLGQFVQILQAMYDLALVEGAAEITREHCQQVTKGEAGSE